MILRKLKSARQHKHGIKLPREDLPNFFDSLSKNDIEDFLEDYEDFRDFGFETLNVDSVRKLKMENEGRKNDSSKYGDRDDIEGNRDVDKDKNEYAIHLDAAQRDGSNPSQRSSATDNELRQVGEPGYQTHRCLNYYL